MNAILDLDTTPALDPDAAWRAVCDRDASQDGRFVFAVRTTGVYCRPSCPARRPRRENVAFFPTPQDAARAGFRACLRCRPDDVPAAQRLVDDACRLLDDADEAPSLASLAGSLGVSAGHLQRTFKRIVGVSPREYFAAQRLARLKQGLRNGEDVTAATYEAGFGSSSRVYANAARSLGMTPGAYRRGGQGMRIFYLISQSAYGPLLVAWTDRGICFVGFAKDETALIADLAAEYPAASLEASAADDRARQVHAVLDGRLRDADLPLDLRGTAFQLTVWQALRSIPYGETRSYTQVAALLGKASSARGVARACATNPVSLLVPCHRVLTSTGGMSGYRWGVDNKRRLLAVESNGRRD